jgi:CSLREA domain-containing protein
MRLVGLIGGILLLAAVVLLRGVSSQTISENDLSNTPQTDKLIPIRAQSRGFSRLGLAVGKDLTTADGTSRNGIAAKLLVSADFDSDGTADLITADPSGNLKFYRGNVDSIYPNTAAANERRRNGNFTADAFLPDVKSFRLTISPDFLTMGDFNADGHQDLLAARKNDSMLYLLAGDGAGNFSAEIRVQIDGTITALTAGEIGRRDGQTDLAVAVQGKRGAQLLVFEQPEGAFNGKPEIIKLPAPANDLAIGNLDTDFFGDIAVAGGNKLTIVRGRGQAHPWDLMPEYGISRPGAIVQTRQLPFAIAALETGHFTVKRSESLAILTTGGTIMTLEAPTLTKKITSQMLGHLDGNILPVPVKNTQKQLNTYRKFAENNSTNKSDLNNSADLLNLNNNNPLDVISNKDLKTPEKTGKLTAGKEQEFITEQLKNPNGSREQAKIGFLNSISPAQNAPLSEWNLQTIVADARLTNAVSSPNAAKLVRIRVSGSSRDELAISDPVSKQIHILARGNERNALRGSDEIFSLDAITSPLAVLPMRLNADALTDLVVLREGSAIPTVVMTAPAATFVVNSTADDDVCSGGGTCTLRGAINASNNTSGSNTIEFNIGGGGMQTISPVDQLPEIGNSVTIDATTQPGYNGYPVIEIKGNQAPEGTNGLLVNSASTVIRGLAINEFRELAEDPDLPAIGGSGISVYNYAGETYATNNIIENNFLGTDPGGTQDRGNDFAGLQIYDSDFNVVGGATPQARNVMSGNGDAEIPNADKFGAGLDIVQGDYTVIWGNYIGLASNGVIALGNSQGVSISGANNLFGGDVAGAGNTVSGNRHLFPVGNDPQGCFGYGVVENSLINLDTGEWVTHDSNYKGNRIGTNASGTIGVGNCRGGIWTSPRNSAAIGSITAAGRNLVSGNNGGGILCSPFQPIEIVGHLLTQFGEMPIPVGFCQIIGNNVGTDINGTYAISNNYDRIPRPEAGTIWTINVQGAIGVFNTDTYSVIGGFDGTSATACTGNCNLVSGNVSGSSPNVVFHTTTGIYRTRYGNVSIFNNYVGTNQSGTAAIPNDDGINIDRAASTSIGDVSTDTNGNQTSLGNLISGNFGAGLQVGFSVGNEYPGLFAHLIRSNLIGTDRNDRDTKRRRSSTAPGYTGRDHSRRRPFVRPKCRFGQLRDRHQIRFTCFVGADNQQLRRGQYQRRTARQRA